MSALPSGPTTAVRCPRCSATFGCAAKTRGCWCGAIELGRFARARLAAEYEGCLCADCLRDVAGTLEQF